jgi:tetratricopeptide (TPR) repeat protein
MAAVSAQLARIQASPRFANAPRLCQLLSYLVENSASGNVRNLLEFSIAVEVFGRGEDFDPQSDTIVRVSARRLRVFLADYYKKQGRDDPVRFRIPTGHYRVKISLREPRAKAAVRAWVSRLWRRRSIPAAALSIIVALLVVGYFRALPTSETPGASTDSRTSPEFLLGQQLLHRRGPGELEQAVEEFEAAVAKDPDDVDAWIGLASALRVLNLQEPDKYEKTLPRQYMALHQALSLDPPHPEANARMAGLHASSGDLAGAIRYMSQALESGGQSYLVLGMIAGQERASGNLERAIELLREATQYPPLNATSFNNLALMLYEAGEFDEALAASYSAEKISPLAPSQKVAIVKTLILQGELGEAGQKLAQLPPGAERQQAMALLEYAYGREEASRQALQSLAEQPASVDQLIRLAEVFAFRGENGRALDEIEAAYQQILTQEWIESIKCEFIQTLLRSPYLASLHQHPRYVAWADRARAYVAGQRSNLLTLAVLEQTPARQ